jgi:hypothetical protein
MFPRCNIYVISLLIYYVTYRAWRGNEVSVDILSIIENKLLEG